MFKHCLQTNTAKNMYQAHELWNHTFKR